MPNHVTNIITFSGDPEAIRKMLDAIKNDEEGYGTIDFNKILPMPSELNIESGSRTTDGLKAYSAFAEIYALGQEPGEADLLNIPEDREKPFLEQRKDIDKKTWNLGKAAFRNLQRFGAATWYSWCTKHWGTKWNAYDCSHNGETLSFLTAWSAPRPVLRELSRLYPEIGISHSWADEDIGNNCGRYQYLAGEITEEFLPAFGRESYEFAADVMNADLSDYGLVLNADESDYIWAGNDHYNVMELLGQRVLHTDYELGLSDIPLGMNLYYLGTTDKQDQFTTIETERPENFGGSVITLQPVELGADGVRELTGEDQPRLTGEKLTMEELLQETITEDEGMGGMNL